MDRILSMILRRLMNIGINKGLNAGMSAFGKRGQKRNNNAPDDDQIAQGGRKPRNHE